MFVIDKNLQIVILIFGAIIFILYKQKPSMMFKKNGKPKDFGSGKDKTITPVWLVALTISLLFYIQFTIRQDDFV
tara:strand:+ start:860 stop:1084 length:225 start_codon:yes stop_codon:yes gene_type:complete